ncbi:MAG: preprotein translocase subunit SecG [Candidatus Deferrimicrobiaceae bacterium]
MHTLIVVLHIVVSLALILIILLQTGKGADIGAVFGGGSSQTLFGSSGPTSFLGKLTAAAAVIFMLTSLFLAYFSGSRPASSIMEGGSPVQTAPAGQPATLPLPEGSPATPGGTAPLAPAPQGTPSPPGK